MQRIKWLITGLVVLFMTGCASLSPLALPKVSQYTFTTWPKTTATPVRAKTQNTILVSLPVASPGYQTSKMVYVQVPYELQSFAHHAWVAPPSELLLPLMANRLRATGHFKAVVTPPFSGGVTYQLNTQLLVLQQEFLRPTSQVRLSIGATLINTATGQVVASRVFETTVEAPENNPYSGVLATNQAVHQLLDRIAGFVAKNV